VVFFASDKEESYIQNSEEREEAGTPDILGCIRAGVVFSLYSRLDLKSLHQREMELTSTFLSRLASDRIQILRNTSSTTPIVSFNIRFDQERLLHHNFVVAVLNDLFGIQVRGGCACAGPFAQQLLGLAESTTQEFHMCLQQSGQEIFRPGFVRLGIHWIMTEAEVELMADAVSWIAKNGWKMLSVYNVDVETGEWRHRNDVHVEEREWISGFDFLNQKLDSLTPKNPTSLKLSDLIAKADGARETMHQQVPLDSVKTPALDTRFKHLVWFALPSDSKDAIQAGGVMSSALSEIVDAESNITPDSTFSSKNKKIVVPKKLRALVTSAIKDFGMIKEGDRLLLGISGGKDSLSLLHILLDCQRKCPFRFEIACATVDPQTPEYQPQALIGYMESLGVKYHYLTQPIVELAKTAMTGKQSICAFCSRMKRGMLYGCMRQNGYNVLALGQHLDDLAESFLMSCFRNGCLSTMKANYTVKEKDLRVIRPLIYVREKMTADFAHKTQLPVIRDNCPACFSAPKERHRIKMLLSTEEYQNNQLFFSMLQAMKPLMGISPAMSTRELIERNLFPIRNSDEDDDRGAEEILLPCSEVACEIAPKIPRLV
jgi:tRNA(Ile)-lysidine synthase TilS/MesJ